MDQVCSPLQVGNPELERLIAQIDNASDAC